MKTFTTLFLMIIGVAIITSCDKDEDFSYSELIGTWMFQESIDDVKVSEKLTFYSDKTGNFVIETTEDGNMDTETLEFTYSINENQLNVNFADGMINISYDVAKNKLTINDDGATTVYTKSGQSGGSNMNVAIL